MAFRVRHIRRIFTHIFLTEEGDDESGKSLSWKVNSCCFQVHCSYSMLFNLPNVDEVFWSWILKDCFYVTKNIQHRCLVFMLSTRRENKAVTARRSGAACDSIKMYKKSVIRVHSCCFANGLIPFWHSHCRSLIWALSTLIHRSTRVHTTTGISMRFRQYARSR